MSPRATRWCLFLGLAGMLPLPILVVASGWVPAGRLLMLGGITVAVMVAETTRGIIGMIAAFLLAQGLLYGAGLWGVASLLSRLLARLPARAAAIVTLGALAVGLAVTLAFDVYTTPFAADAATGNLLQVYR